MRLDGLRYEEIEIAQDETKNMVTVGGIVGTVQLYDVYVTSIEV